MSHAFIVVIRTRRCKEKLQCLAQGHVGVMAGFIQCSEVCSFVRQLLVRGS